MSMRMLIDARHPEETRVAVVKGSRIEEFDFESAEHKQLKGNIYLAKVTRVEPSLQAAFVDYGGNRHGFLAFSEIHPDYYQIPKADRDALLREEAEHAAEEERLRSAGYDDDDHHDDDHHDDDHHDDRHDDDGFDDDHQAIDTTTAQATNVAADSGTGAATSSESGSGPNRSPVDESAADELRKKRQALRRRYKIQDVIQRRQVLLVQVVKEERGNKGAALTTYLSLAGRYCVLMPNTSHGGGISRKISNGADRKRLKSIMSDLSLPSTMGLIVRTAGLSRTKTEIKRDFDYLARLWDEIREKTLGSSAPALIYRDSDLIKRAIRDLYHREIDEVCVEGEDGYKAARGFMKLLMPSHVRRVKLHSESVPMFQRYGVEDQLSAMYQPLVQLKSGGYLVINPTEALVSIDINSGRSTREHNIEQTAFATNLEAAAEIARQLRLRDMAGLVVIDFIDMEQNSHVRKVERAMKDALKNDRARIQVGRISSFGLMEMSRQRLRTGVLEASTKPCPHCDGSGLMRTASSAGLSALRMIDDEAARGRGEKILLRAGRDAAIYVLNKKRAELAEVEQRYGVSVEIVIDEAFEGARMTVESSGPRPVAPVAPPQSSLPSFDEDDAVDEIDDIDAEELDGDDEGDVADESDDTVEISLEGGEAGSDEEGDRHSRRRRRRRRGGRGRGRRDHEGAAETGVEALAADAAEQGDDADAPRAEAPQAESAPARPDDDRPARSPRRRRGRRSDAETTIEPDSSPMVERPIDEEPPIADTAPIEPSAPVETGTADEPAPKPRRSRRKATAEPAASDDAPAPAAPKPASVSDAAASTAPEEEGPAKPTRRRRTKAVTAAATEAPVEASAPTPEPEAEADESSAAGAANDDTSGSEGGGETRRGWWQRTFG